MLNFCFEKLSYKDPNDLLIIRKGRGLISAAGGGGLAGGGGGRISLNCYSIQEYIKVTVRGM